MMRDAGAALAGLVTAFVSIYLIESLGHTLYPPPAGLDQTNAEAMQSYVALLPLPALLFPVFAYCFGTVAGTLVGSLAGTARPAVFALIVGLLVLSGTVATLIWIPHPLWYSIGAVLGIVGSAWLGMKTGAVMRR